MSTKPKTIDSFYDWFHHASPSTECKILTHLYNQNVDYLLSSKNADKYRQYLEEGYTILDDNMPLSVSEFSTLRRGLENLSGNEKKAFYQKYFKVGLDKPIDQPSLKSAERKYARYVDEQLGTFPYVSAYFTEKTKDRVRRKKESKYYR